MKLESHIREDFITRRDILILQSLLRMNFSLFAGKKLLNFGCGGTNIGEFLKGVNPKTIVVDMDILPDPIAVHTNTIYPEERKFLEGITKIKSENDGDMRHYEEVGIGEYVHQPYHFDDHSRLRFMDDRIKRSLDPQQSFPQINDHENQFFGIANRNFIQVTKGDFQIKDENGRLVKCPDNYYDYAILSWVIHQIDREDLDHYLSEILRTTKTIIIAPIWQEHIDKLKEIMTKSGHRISLIAQTSENHDHANSFLINNEKDIANGQPEYRWYKPGYRPQYGWGDGPKSIISKDFAVIVITK